MFLIREFSNLNIDWNCMETKIEVLAGSEWNELGLITF